VYLQEAQRGQIDEPGRQTRSLSGQIAGERLVLPALESRTLVTTVSALVGAPSALAPLHLCQIGRGSRAHEMRLGAASVGHLRWALWWRRS